MALGALGLFDDWRDVGSEVFCASGSGLAPEQLESLRPLEEQLYRVGIESYDAKKVVDKDLLLVHLLTTDRRLLHLPEEQLSLTSVG